MSRYPTSPPAKASSAPNISARGADDKSFAPGSYAYEDGGLDLVLARYDTDRDYAVHIFDWAEWHWWVRFSSECTGERDHFAHLATRQEWRNEQRPVTYKRDVPVAASQGCYEFGIADALAPIHSDADATLAAYTICGYLKSAASSDAVIESVEAKFLAQCASALPTYDLEFFKAIWRRALEKAEPPSPETVRKRHADYIFSEAPSIFETFDALNGDRPGAPDAAAVKGAIAATLALLMEDSSSFAVRMVAYDLAAFAVAMKLDMDAVEARFLAAHAQVSGEAAEVDFAEKWRLGVEHAKEFPHPKAANDDKPQDRPADSAQKVEKILAKLRGGQLSIDQAARDVVMVVAKHGLDAEAVKVQFTCAAKAGLNGSSDPASIEASWDAAWAPPPPEPPKGNSKTGKRGANRKAKEDGDEGAPEAELESWPSKGLRLCPPYKENWFGIRLVTVDKKENEVVSPLTNFCARIVQEIVHDDGAEISRRFKIEGYLDGRYHLFTVSAAEFARLDWVISQMGSKAIIVAGHGKRDHLRAAIQTLSPRHPPEQRVYAHTGWRKIDGREVYLHAGGAIGAEGAVPGIETDFGAHGRLALAMLPDPPSGEALKRAIRESLAFLDLGPLRVTAPLYAAIWRAPLKDSDFSISECGETGVFKTELAALAQQHWGAGFIASNLPGSWASTSNSLETMAFAAKDMIFVVDDFAPSGARTDIDRMHREAARLYRAQGNQSGRGRLRADTAQRPAKYPRGIIMSTGEDLPRGHSVQARQFIIEVKGGDIDAGKLTLAQKAAAAGTYAEAMSGWLRYLAATPAAWRAFKDNRDRLSVAAKDDEHARTPRIASSLLAALRAFLDFAVQAGAIGAEEADQRYGKCETAIREGAGDQQKHMRAQDPALRFFELIGAAVATGKAHLANTSDGQSEPPNYAAWGWQQATWTVDGHRCTDTKPKGELIGWTEVGDIAWLEPSSAYGLAQKLAAAEGIPLSIGKETLWRRLADANKLAARSEGRNLHKKNIGGSNRNLLAVFASSLRPPEQAAEAD